MTRLSNRVNTYTYWKACVSRIKKDNPFFNKDKQNLLKEVIKVTHGTGGNPFIFWMAPDGKIVESPKGHIFPTDEFTGPDEYQTAGFLRGRVSTLSDGQQVVLIYTEVTDILGQRRKLEQLKKGINQFPMPIQIDTVIVMNGSILGTVGDLESGQLG